MSDTYVLNDDNSVREVSTSEWGDWVQQNPERKRVGYDEIVGARVSTVFLGLDHQWGGGPPLLFETMVFEPDDWADKLCWRYSTYKEAKAGHAQALALVRRHLASKGTLDGLDYSQ